MIHGARHRRVASNTANFVISEIIRFGRVRRAFIGVSADTTNLPRRAAFVAGVEQTAVRLRSVEANSPAAKAGLKEGDIIAAIDGRPVTGVDDLRACSMPSASSARRCVRSCAARRQPGRGHACGEGELSATPTGNCLASRPFYKLRLKFRVKRDRLDHVDQHPIGVLVMK
jgi:hypothetical protein